MKSIEINESTRSKGGTKVLYSHLLGRNRYFQSLRSHDVGTADVVAYYVRETAEPPPPYEIGPCIEQDPEVNNPLRRNE